MVSYYDESDNENAAEKVYREFYFADFQSWDAATLKQLRDEFNIFFMSSGDGVVPVKVCKNSELVALGEEDDGTISFLKWGNGQYVQSFHFSFVKHLIFDLQEAEKSFNLK